jgi:hypothetical protein
MRLSALLSGSLKRTSLLSTTRLEEEYMSRAVLIFSKLVSSFVANIA